MTSPSAAIACTPNRHVNAIAARPTVHIDRGRASFLAEYSRRIECWIGREPVAIGHLDLWQFFTVELSIRGKNSVQAQNVGGDRVGVVSAEAV